MAINKKGYFFSLTVLLLIGIAALIFSSTRDPGYERQALATSGRLMELNNFIISVEEDAATATYVAGHRALLTLQDYIRENGAIINPEELLTILITNGTINEEIQPYLINASIEDWEARIQPIASQLRTIFTIEIEQITITQEDPWFVTIYLDALLHLEDEYTTSTWDQQINKKILISIKDFQDPLYTIKSEGRYIQPITPTTHNDITSLVDHIENQRYIATNQAPSYLERFTGSIDPSPYGIESLVNVSALQAVDIINKGSIIDWQYLGENVIEDLVSIPDTPPWGIIPTKDLERYEDFI